MRFVDASVFLYAYLRPRRTIPHHIVRMKKAAKSIVKRINEGEAAVTSLAHISEMANILEAVMPPDESYKMTRDLIMTETMSILEPAGANYLAAIERAEEIGVGLNDALAYLLMKTEGINEIYSFDRHFDRFKDIMRIAR